MKIDVKTHVDAALSNVVWTAEMSDTVLKSCRPVAPQKHPRRTLRFALLFALLLALGATALAIGLNYSPRYTLIVKSRAALQTRYHLTDEMLDLFSVSIRQEGNAWTATFEPLGLVPDKMGVYTVSQTADGRISATWSFDGADGADLSDSAWGAAALQTALDARRRAEFMAQAPIIENNESMETVAAVDARLTSEEAQAFYLLSIAPLEMDISKTDAAMIAKSAVEQKYGVPPEVLIEEDVNFYLYPKTGLREYRVLLKAPPEPGAEEVYIHVTLTSPLGEVTQCVCLGDIPLPGGDLSPYLKAVEEYVDSGAFARLEAKDKAALAARIKAAGFHDLMLNKAYLSPTAEDINKEQALEGALAALRDVFDFPESGLRFFETQTALLGWKDMRVWEIVYAPVDDMMFYPGFSEKMGQYTVYINASDGAVMSALWSLSGVDDAPYTEKNWGQAKVISAPLLTCVGALLDAQERILSAYPPYTNIGEMSDADNAAYHRLMLEAGFMLSYYYTLPKDGDVEKEQAFALANVALVDGRGLSEALLNDCEVDIKMRGCFVDGGEDTRQWCVTYWGYGEDKTDLYTVILDAQTGALEEIVHDSPASGNG